MSLLLTNNASPRSSDGMMPGFLVEEGRGMEKLVIVAISLNLFTESLLAARGFQIGIDRHGTLGALGTDY